MNIGILGLGFVGEAVCEGFEPLVDKVNVYDPKYGHGKDVFEEVINDSCIIFICVPGPTNFERQTQDLSILHCVLEDCSKIKDIQEKILVIKSTVSPGTTAEYQNLFPNLRLIHNPEFLTEANHLEDFENQDRIVLGGNKLDCEWVQLLYMLGWPDACYYIMNSTEAELVKYFCNCTLAVKVALFNEFYSICEKSTAVSFNAVRHAVCADERIGSSHSMVPGPDGEFGFGGKCFSKDINVLIGLAKRLCAESNILEASWKTNLKVRKNRDWEDIEGVTSDK